MASSSSITATSSSRWPMRLAHDVEAGPHNGPSHIACRDAQRVRNAPNLGNGLKAVPYLVVLACTAVSAQGPADWAQFRGNARLSGVAAAELPSTLTLRWT